MSNDNVKTLSATFPTRESADLAIEHLVQQVGIARADVFVQASKADNTSGVSPSGGDAGRSDAPLHGVIEVSADVADAQVIKAERALRDAGAQTVLAR